MKEGLEIQVGGVGEVLKEGLEIQVGGVGASLERGSGNPGRRGGGKS